MSRLAVVMIGAGGFARRHLEVLEGYADVEIVGHQARRREAAAEQARRFGGQAFDSVDALLDTCRPDAAWIVLPPGAHGPPEDACLDRGVPFFVEKPLSAGREPAERIASAVERSGLVTAVGYHWRALDILPEVRDALAGREVRLVRGSWHDATPAPAWWAKRSESGGQIVEQATHVLDLARVLLGEAEVVAALAPVVHRSDWPESDVAAASAALLRYRSGPIGVFSATCALAGPAEIELEIYAEGRRVTVDQRHVQIDDGATTRRTVVRDDPVDTENRAFLHAVQSGDARSVIASYADALASHRLAIAIQADGDTREGLDSASTGH